ncbi:hypothetical protein [Deinococcus peraridilitoris]|uniref:Uncharacterized protein n=1 Tax=Deinococcus peraridilitoris (strain DSM 19664 / LMG 22246 / CIP 109416 / KR-200) TaxID=937777 RepID=K9ZZE4_DEIPD|nr:hypothetical protein [Deinococcus peraridilitoris]AFZ67018.1 hypothetical protein Deipe_1477 [Deinococcus peraridilitoris DSM 19664]
MGRFLLALIVVAAAIKAMAAGLAAPHNPHLLVDAALYTALAIVGGKALSQAIAWKGARS